MLINAAGVSSVVDEGAGVVEAVDEVSTVGDEDTA